MNLRGFDPAGPQLGPAEAIRSFLDALGLPPQRIPADADEQVRLYRSLLAAKRMLIVLDNARDERQVRTLIPDGPGCRVVVTSRNDLPGLIAAHAAHCLNLDVRGCRSRWPSPLLARRRAADSAMAAALWLNPRLLPLDLAARVPGAVSTTFATEVQALAWFEAERSVLLARDHGR